MKTLLIIDVQKGFINQNNEEIVSNINSIVGKFDVVIATQFVNNHCTQHSKVLNWNKMMESDEVALAFNLPKNTHIIQKSTYALPAGVFSERGLMLEENILIPKGEEIYLCGTDYDACVLAVAYQLFDNGFVPIKNF